MEKNKTKKSKEKITFNSKEKEIITYLYKRGGLVTPHKISKDTGISYITTLKYLKILSDKKVVLPIYYVLKLSRVKSIDGAIRAAKRSNKVTAERKKRGKSIRYQLNPIVFGAVSKQSKKNKKEV